MTPQIQKLAKKWSETAQNKVKAVVDGDWEVSTQGQRDVTVRHKGEMVEDACDALVPGMIYGQSAGKSVWPPNVPFPAIPEEASEPVENYRVVCEVPPTCPTEAGEPQADYSKMTKNELLTLCKGRGLEADTKSKKAELIALLESDGL